MGAEGQEGTWAGRVVQGGSSRSEGLYLPQAELSLPSPGCPRHQQKSSSRVEPWGSLGPAEVSKQDVTPRDMLFHHPFVTIQSRACDLHPERKLHSSQRLCNQHHAGIAQFGDTSPSPNHQHLLPHPHALQGLVTPVSTVLVSGLLPCCTLGLLRNRVHSSATHRVLTKTRHQ